MKNNVVIIGGGAAGISTLLQLVEKLAEQKQTGITIHIVEKSNLVGGGLPYKTNEKSHILNLSAELMSVTPSNPHDFIDWLKEKNIKITSHYPPRELFGKYLEDIAKKAIKIAEKNGNTVHFICNEEAIDIDDMREDTKIDANFIIYLKSGTCLLAEQIILCLGHLPSNTYTQFISHKNYYHSPWEKDKKIINIPKNKDIFIIGSRLTAIDSVLELIDNGHQGKLIMCSRNGLLPCVIGLSEPYEKKILTLEKISELTCNGIKPIKLKQILELFWAEISHAQGERITFDDIMSIKMSPVEWLESEIKVVNPRPWQSVLTSIYPIVPNIWHALDIEGKKEFLDKYYSLWMTYLAAFPKENAKKILELLKSGQVEVKSGLRNIEFDEKCNVYTLKFDAEIKSADYLINATGPGSSIEQSNSKLLQNLLNKNIISINPIGGIDVDFRTLRIKNTSNEKTNCLYAVGEITRGTHLATTDLCQVSKQGQRAAYCVANYIMQPNFLIENRQTKKSVSHLYMHNTRSSKNVTPKSNSSIGIFFKTDEKNLHQSPIIEKEEFKNKNSFRHSKL